MRFKSIVPLLGGPLLVGLTFAAGTVRADVVTDWNFAAVNAIRNAGVGPNPATRVLAISHIAIHDALATLSGKYETYHAALTPTGNVDPEIAAIAAAHKVLVTLLPTQQAILDAEYSDDLAGYANGATKTNSITLGEAAATDILTLRTGDGSAAPDEAYFNGTADGEWRATPPGYLAASQPQWRSVQPFGLVSADQFRPGAPPAVGTTDYTTALTQVETLGAKTGSTRTGAQTTTATFWIQATHIPLNAIARQVVQKLEIDLDESARTFALLNIALADSRIAAWDAKYHYGWWRPETALNDGVPDGGTLWEPFIVTPNHPDYPSGHSTTGAAGAQLLTRLFGLQQFTVQSENVPGTTKTFNNFRAAQIENGLSRIYGGIHTSYANTAGQSLGQDIGDYIDANLLQAVTPDAGADAGFDAGADAGDGGDGGDGGIIVFLDSGVDVDASLPDVDASDPIDASVGGNATGGSPTDLDAATGGTSSGGAAGNPANAGSPSGGTSSADAGFPVPVEESDEGCSCSVPGKSSNSSSGITALAVLSLMLHRRRRS
jgi:MYXO-CTERM domain-containing protein